MYRIFDAQHVYKFLRNLETRTSIILQAMYRTFGAQHGYKPIGLEPRECIATSLLNMVTMFSTSEHRASEIFDFVSMLKTQSV